MNAEPTGVPERLGPYRVDGLWHADDVGVVLDAQGPSGRVELVLLGAAPGHDATARARFATAAASLRRSGSVLHDGSTEDVPWVAIAAGSGPQGAQPLLAPIWPDVVEDNVRGPQYVPHWRGMPSAYPMRPHPLPGHARLPWWWWLVGFLIALGILILLASCLPSSEDGGGGEQSGTVSQSGPSDSQSSSDPSGTPSSSSSSSQSSSGSSSSSSTDSPTSSPSGSTGGTSPEPSGSPSDLGTGTLPPPQDPSAKL